MKKQGMIAVISGFSGVGKGTIIKELIKKYNYALSISATSRLPRDGEKNGREYFFLTKEEFNSKIKSNGFIEWACYVDNYYGTPRDFVEEKLKNGEDIILEIEPQGALNIKKQYKDAILIFVTPPNFKELESRLVKRGTEDLKTIQKRLKRASEETEFISNYDYVVINDDLSEAIEDINHIIKGASNKRENLSEFIHFMIEELKTSTERND